MKKLFIIILVLAHTLSLLSCGDTSILAEDDVKQFSYEKDKSYYDGYSVGIYNDGFINTTPVFIESANDVLNLAKRECTVRYSNVEIFRDENADIWKVLFYTENILGGDQTVYIDNTGVTIWTIYGE